MLINMALCVWVFFGSVARGEQTENSDVDVCVEGQLHGFFALAGNKARVGRIIAAKWILYACEIEWISFYCEGIQREGIYVLTR